MSLLCRNGNGETFWLGTTSFGFLDHKNIFDEFNENLDIHSEIILKVTGKEKLNLLAEKIIQSINNDKTAFRFDLKEKLLKWAEYLKVSDTIEIVT